MFFLIINSKRRLLVLTIIVTSRDPTGCEAPLDVLIQNAYFPTLSIFVFIGKNNFSKRI